MLLDDGFSTKYVFGTSTITLYEETEVEMPSLGGGGSKNVTTMHNVAARTKKPKKLMDVGNITATVRYDPAILDQIKAAIQVNQLITVTNPDGSEEEYWGWLEEFNRDTLVEGEAPTAEMVIEISNLNASDVETLPVYTAPPVEP